METKDIEKKLNDFLDLLKSLNSKLEIDSKKENLNKLNKETLEIDFWNRTDSKEVLEEIKKLNYTLDKFNKINDSVLTLKEMLELDLTEDDINSIIEALTNIEKEIEELKLSTYLSGEFDS